MFEWLEYLSNEKFMMEFFVGVTEKTRFIRAESAFIQREQIRGFTAFEFADWEGSARYNMGKHFLSRSA